jgi:hypothetical protein
LAFKLGSFEGQFYLLYIFVHLIIHQELRKIVEDLPVIEAPAKISASILLKLRKPRNVGEAVVYCELLQQHFHIVCDGKSASIWERLDRPGFLDG